MSRAGVMMFALPSTSYLTSKIGCKEMKLCHCKAGTNSYRQVMREESPYQSSVWVVPCLGRAVRDRDRWR